MANLAGFEILASDNPNSHFYRYYYSKGGCKHEKNIRSEKIIISTKNICLAHNHKLHPSMFYYKAIDDSVLAIIHQMYQIFLHIKLGNFYACKVLSTYQNNK